MEHSKNIQQPQNHGDHYNAIQKNTYNDQSFENLE
jgi:hypothetical protein